MAEAASVLIPQIHHEKQESGSMLCAQHALNALLQGNYYDPSQLADIAKQLDQLEQSHLDAETWQARGNDANSLNMDDTGYFSVSVLENALEVWGLRLVRWRSEEMQPLQDKPEEQLAFVLNLESHWFTIRSFTGGYWFNLNSFLEKPSWVGQSYLGALLNAAETEGYSVFVVRAAADHAIGNLRSSAADECAATLPPASELANSSAAEQSSASASHGLRPSTKKTTMPLASPGLDADDDADIQAALQASLAHAAISTNSNEGQSSRMQSPTIVGQRRTRMGPSNGDTDMDDQEETDAHVDAIAPSRRRVRGLMDATSAATPTASSSRTSPYILPTASGGRRRASRQQQNDDDDGHRPRAGSGMGSSRDNAISIDDDSFQNDGRRRRTAITIGDDDDDDVDDNDGVDLLGATASSALRSPFLNPAIFNAAGGSGSNSEDDFHSLSDGEGGGLGESMIQNDIDALRGHASMRGNRDYDDEDAQLQAALAASMQQGQLGGDAEAGGQGGGYVDELAAADWLNEEDARAIREAQASFGAATSAPMMRSTSSRNSPPPADVERIARMRAEAQRKAKEEEEARLRGEDPSAPKAADPQGLGGGDQDSDDEDDSSGDEAPQMSPEEMRRARLARFGG